MNGEEVMPPRQHEKYSKSIRSHHLNQKIHHHRTHTFDTIVQKFCLLFMVCIRDRNLVTSTEYPIYKCIYAILYFSTSFFHILHLLFHLRFLLLCVGFFSNLKRKERDVNRNRRHNKKNRVSCVRTGV